MENKQLNILACAGAFFLGAFFVLSDHAGITANVIGYNGSEHAITSLIGVVMIVASAGLFALQISLEGVVKSNAHKHPVVASDGSKYINPNQDKYSAEESEKQD